VAAAEVDERSEMSVDACGDGRIDDKIDDGIDDAEPWSVAEYLARSLRVSGGTGDLVSTVAEEAVRLVPAARHCGVIVTSPSRQLETVATTGPVPERLDLLQQQTGRGPCLTAARKQIVVRIHDIATDTRWDGFREAAVESGVSSMLCLPLYVDDRVLGTLSLYGTEPDVFREGAEPVARLLAALAAIALADARHAEQMQRALRSRDLIGQAKGILMREHGITADDAFALLRTHSQNANIKLVDVANRVVETGTLETAPAAGG
jgi:GAF domain-containing protein